jgi:hypothetical protein
VDEVWAFYQRNARGQAFLYAIMRRRGAQVIMSQEPNNSPSRLSGDAVAKLFPTVNAKYRFT